MIDSERKEKCREEKKNNLHFGLHLHDNIQVFLHLH